MIKVLITTGQIILLLCLISCTQNVRTLNNNFTELSDKANFPGSKTDSAKLADRSLDELIDTGNHYLGNENYQLAKVHFKAAIKKCPESSDAYIGLGKADFHLGIIHEAFQAYLLSLEYDPESIDSMVWLARLSRMVGKNDLALSYLEKALLSSPDDPVVLAEWAITYDAAGEFGCAEPLHKKVLSLKSNQAFSYNNIGFNYLLQAKYDDAIAAFRQAMYLQPNNARIQNNMAAAYALSDNEAMALRLMEGTVGKAAAYNNLGYFYIIQGNWEKAEKALSQALELNPRFYVRAKKNLALLKRMREESALGNRGLLKAD